MVSVFANNPSLPQAGARAPGLSLFNLLNNYAYGGYSYNGGTDLISLLRWQNLSDTPEKIINLRWTELAANMMTGSKSRLDASPNGQGEVLMHQKTVTYRYECGIAAYICCGLWLAWAAACLYMLCVPRLRGRLSRDSLRVAVNSLSAGRLLVWRKDGRGRDSELLLKMKMSTRDWLRTEGGRVVNSSAAVEGPEEGGMDTDTELVRTAAPIDGVVSRVPSSSGVERRWTRGNRGTGLGAREGDPLSE